MRYREAARKLRGWAVTRFQRAAAAPTGDGSTLKHDLTRHPRTIPDIRTILVIPGSSLVIPAKAGIQRTAGATCRP